ncbi:g7615 [Coccomyxa elongata]
MAKDSDLETRLKEETYSLTVSLPTDNLAVRVTKFASHVLAHAEVIRKREISAELMNSLLHFLMVNIEELVLRSIERFGIVEAWMLAQTALEPFAETAGDGKEDALSAHVYETLQRFWEGIAAHILQPDDPMAVFACTACRLLDAGLLQKLLEDLWHAGKHYTMPFLAYADTQPAVLLLFMLECLDSKPPAPDSPAICSLQRRLEARPNNLNDPASGQKQIFEALTSLLLPEAESVLNWIFRQPQMPTTEHLYNFSKMLVRACRALTTAALFRKQCRLLMLFVGHTDAAEHILRSLLALPECRGDGKNGAPLAIHIFKTIHAKQPQWLLSTLAALLEPESNSSVNVRALALTSILEVCLTEKSDAIDAIEGMSAFTFPHDALQHIVFALKTDTSVRIRRLGIETLQTVMTMPLEVPEGIKDVLDTLVLKCRDKDSKVRHASFHCLDGADPALLANFVSIDDWRSVHAMGFGVHETCLC